MYSSALSPPGAAVGLKLVRARLGFGVSAAGVLRHHAVGEVVIGVTFLFRERPALPLVERVSAAGRLVLRDVGVQHLLLLDDVPGLPCLRYDGLPVRPGEDGHEGLAELPTCQPGLLLEVDLEPVGVQRLRVVEELGVHYRRPVARELQLGGSVGGEHEVLGGDIAAVAPLDSLLQGHLGGPEGLTADGFLNQRGGEIGGQRGHPVESLGRVGVQAGLGSSQHVQVPDGAILPQIRPVVGSSQVRRDSQLVNVFGGVGCGRRRLRSRRRGGRWSVRARRRSGGGSCGRRGSRRLASLGVLAGCVGIRRGRDHHLDLHLPNHFLRHHLRLATQQRNCQKYQGAKYQQSHRTHQLFLLFQCGESITPVL